MYIMFPFNPLWQAYPVFECEEVATQIVYRRDGPTGLKYLVKTDTEYIELYTRFSAVINLVSDSVVERYIPIKKLTNKQFKSLQFFEALPPDDLPLIDENSDLYRSLFGSFNGRYDDKDL